jgi:VWFA-related protein
MTIRGTICFAPAVLFFLFPAAAVAQPAPPAFKAETNLVLAPVVVRDAKGEVVANLGKEDFRLFDNGKEREITSFSLEETSGRVAEDRSQPTGKKADAAPMVMPAHFVALMFDDVHIGDYGDLTYTRNAVRKYLDKLQPVDRVAFFTVSGFTNVDFTADRAKIVDAMMKLGTGPSGVSDNYHYRVRQDCQPDGAIARPTHLCLPLSRPDNSRTDVDRSAAGDADDRPCHSISGSD